MTEKAFRELVVTLQGVEHIVLAAKEAGAKFDPEPVELPRLGVPPFSLEAPALVMAESAGGYSRLTEPEAREIVRRCNAWPAILRLLRNELTVTSMANGKAMLRIMEGQP